MQAMLICNIVFSSTTYSYVALHINIAMHVNFIKLQNTIIQWGTVGWGTMLQDERLQI
jgi:hypothetical protein